MSATTEKAILESLGLPADFRSGFVALIGPANAGKSTLLNSIIGEKISIVSPKAQTTRDRILGVKTDNTAQFVFLDTPGFLGGGHKGALAGYLNDSLREASSDIDAVVLLVDGARAIKESSCGNNLRRSIKDRKVPLPSIIVINKIDMIQKDRLLPLIADLDAAFSDSDPKPLIVPVSAKTGDGIDVLLKELKAMLPEGVPHFPDDMHTDQPERFLAAEIVREKLFQQLNQELPYSVAVQVESWEENERLLRIASVIFVERDSQRGIVIGAKGSKLKAVGTAARHELEECFGKKVHLELFVRVEPHWTKTTKGLRKAGYRSGGYPQ